MNGIYILLTILLYFGILLLVARLTGRHSDNDAFFRGNRRSPWYIVSFGMIGASLSGVTFVSVPGMVRGIDMTYMQTCFGFFIGYLIIAHVLLPLYYRLNLTSIYTYLGDRIGRHAYKTGASFFLLSKIIGAAARLYLVCLILQHYVFDAFHIPFAATVIGIVLLIWLYTRRSGIRTIVWTDSLQTLCLLLALGLILYEVSGQLDLDFPGLVHAIRENEHSRIFVFDDWHSKQNFFKQFFSGIFITIVMTGLDQDMMQKNLSCKNLREAQKNMYCYGISFVPVNFLFLSLGILLLLFASQLNIPLPAAGDEILPLFAAEGHLGFAVLIFFTIGIIAAAFSSADSALTALTTSFCIDIAGISHLSGKEAERRRKLVHFCISVLFIGFILLFKAVNNKSVIDAIYTIASYTYGPLLGLFAFGLFTPMRPRDRFVPYIAIASPLLCYAIDRLVFTSTGYQFGYEMLMFNGFLTFMGLTCLSIKTRIMEILSAEFVVSNTKVEKCPQDNLPEYAFIGRSNVGKSSLINMLAKRPKLAMTSSTPGKTLLINHFLINKEWYLVDLPGYGYASRGKKQVEKIQQIIEDYILEREQMTNLFVLIDCRLEPQKIDLEFMEWLGENGVPFSIIFTKADKLTNGKVKDNVNKYLKKLTEQWEELPPHFVSSSEKKTGRQEILDYIDSINRSLKA